ncbi:uncharacterized protein LW93_5434 [Fusarium fujikuroi]|nr:uncharacterized protein LW93_5434 [Fusarium fujikuroi]
MDHQEVSRRNGAAKRPNTNLKVGASSSGLVDQADPLCEHSSVHNCANLTRHGCGSHVLGRNIGRVHWRIGKHNAGGVRLMGFRRVQLRCHYSRTKAT